jgi:hypothetical protein
MTTRDPNETVHVKLDNLGLTVLEKIQALETTVGQVVSQLVDKLYHSTPTAGASTTPAQTILQTAVPLAEDVAVAAAEHEL